MCEDWKDILEYEDCYQVSNLGRIRTKERQVTCKGNKTRTVKPRIRKCFCNNKGYPTVVLSKNNVLKTSAAIDKHAIGVAKIINTIPPTVS